MPILPPVGSFNITQLCDKADKIGKDTNFRGLTTFNNVLYTTKGSGGNGINTVYFIDTTGKACPTGANPCVPGGVGLPESSATLPTAGIPYDPSLLQTDGVVPYNMCILNGFNQVLAKTTTDVFPFGVWFANANTLYVADEGNGDNTNTTIPRPPAPTMEPTRMPRPRRRQDYRNGYWSRACGKTSILCRRG